MPIVARVFDDSIEGLACMMQDLHNTNPGVLYFLLHSVDSIDPEYEAATFLQRRYSVDPNMINLDGNAPESFRLFADKFDGTLAWRMVKEAEIVELNMLEYGEQIVYVMMNRLTAMTGVGRQVLSALLELYDLLDYGFKEASHLEKLPTLAASSMVSYLSLPRYFSEHADIAQLEKIWEVYRRRFDELETRLLTRLPEEVLHVFQEAACNLVGLVQQQLVNTPYSMENARFYTLN
jgi:hypothetical protein